MLLLFLSTLFYTRFSDHYRNSLSGRLNQIFVDVSSEYSPPRFESFVNSSLPPQDIFFSWLFSVRSMHVFSTSYNCSNFLVILSSQPKLWLTLCIQHQPSLYLPLKIKLGETLTFSTMCTFPTTITLVSISSQCICQVLIIRRWSQPFCVKKIVYFLKPLDFIITDYGKWDSDWGLFKKKSKNKMKVGCPYVFFYSFYIN